MKAAMASVEQTLEQVQASDVAKNLTTIANDVANADYSYEGMREKLDQAADMLDVAAEQAVLAGTAAVERAAEAYDDAKATVEKVAIEAREKVAAVAGDEFPSKWDIARIHQDLEEQEKRDEEEQDDDDQVEEEREKEVNDDEAWKAQGYEKYWDEDASAWYWYHSTNGDTHWAEGAGTKKGALGEQEEVAARQWADPYHSHGVTTAWGGGWKGGDHAAGAATSGAAAGAKATATTHYAAQDSGEEWQRVYDETKQMEYWIKPSTGEYHWITDEQ